MWKVVLLVSFASVVLQDAVAQGGAESIPFPGFLPSEKIRALAPEADDQPNDIYQHIPVRRPELKDDEVVIYPHHFEFEFGQDPEHRIYEVHSAKELASLRKHGKHGKNAHDDTKDHHHHEHDHNDIASKGTAKNSAPITLSKPVPSPNAHTAPHPPPPRHPSNNFPPPPPPHGAFPPPPPGAFPPSPSHPYPYRHQAAFPPRLSHQGLSPGLCAMIV